MMKMSFMKVLILFVAAGVAASQVSFAQMDPNQPSASSTQPNRSPQQQQPASTSILESSNGPDMTAGMIRDKAFLNKVGEGGLAEVEMGKLAAQKGNSPEVKSLGQQMVTDHTALNKQMAEVADNLGFRMPKDLSKEGKASYDHLSSLSGDDFDKEYLAMMVKDHHRDLRELRMEAIATQDTNVHEAVVKAAEVVRSHMVEIDKLARDKGVPMPGRRQAPPAQQ